MKDQPQDDRLYSQCEHPMRNARISFWPVCSKMVALVLLLGLTGLATSAKDAQYFRTSKIEHESSLSTKMNVPPAPVILSSVDIQKVARIIATKPQETYRPRFKPEPLPTESVGVTVAMQHRSPPESRL
jgi:hypothetical protein